MLTGTALINELVDELNCFHLIFAITAYIVFSQNPYPTAYPCNFLLSSGESLCYNNVCVG